MRPLVMDFPNDPTAIEEKYEYMFGPAILVCPVITAGATTESVYLPAGTGWTNFWTGTHYSGGQTITANCPINIEPLYVRDGSILPLGPAVQYDSLAASTIELRIYPGANASFNLYEDEGVNNNYQNGTSATIPISWNNSSQLLTIGSRSGSFPGMLSSRTFRCALVVPGEGGVNPVGLPNVTLSYSGSSIGQGLVPFGSYGTEGPYGGTAWSVPGTIQAENYDTGGFGIGYSTSASSNQGGQYRDDNVGIENCSDTGGGYDVGWLTQAEMLNYTVNVTTAGPYTIAIRCAAGMSGGAMHFEDEFGTNLTGSITIPYTGGYQSWTTINATANLQLGQHIIRAVVDSGAGSFNWNYFTFTQTPGLLSTPFGGAPAAIPGSIYAANFDLGGQGIAYNTTATANSGGAYRTAENIGIENCSDAGVLYDVGWNNSGNWMNYTVSVPAAGTYTVTFRVANGSSPTTFHLQNSAGQNLTGPVSVAYTGGSQSWTNASASITLPAGTQVLTLYIDSTSGGVNFDKMTFASQAVGVQIDCGSSSAVNPFSADVDFSGGQVETSSATINTGNAISPAPAAVYQSLRWGPTTYTIPNLTVNASYTVRLHFCELFWSSAGQRAFNVAINGTTVLSNFDIVATAGAQNVAVTEAFTATANSSGKIVISLTNGSADNAAISGIEVLP
jgi:hypothetical protein